MIYEIGLECGAESVVDIDDTDAGCTGIEHGQKGCQTMEGLHRVYPKDCVNLHTDVRQTYEYGGFDLARRKSDSPQKAALREMMSNYMKENDVHIKDGTNVNSIMRDMLPGCELDVCR